MEGWTGREIMAEKVSNLKLTSHLKFSTPKISNAHYNEKVFNQRQDFKGNKRKKKLTYKGNPYKAISLFISKHLTDQKKVG